MFKLTFQLKLLPKTSTPKMTYEMRAAYEQSLSWLYGEQLGYGEDGEEEDDWNKNVTGCHGGQCGYMGGHIDWRNWKSFGVNAPLYGYDGWGDDSDYDDSDYDETEFVGIYFYELLEEGDVPDMACVPFKTDPKKNRGRKDHHTKGEKKPPQKSSRSKKESVHHRSPKRRVKVSRAHLRREILFDRREMDTDYKDPDPETFDEIELNKENKESVVIEETPIKESVVAEEYHHCPFEQYKVDKKKNRGRKNRHTKSYPKLGLKNNKQRNQTSPHKRRRGSSQVEIKRLIDEWIHPTEIEEERHEVTNWIENMNLKGEKHIDVELGFLVAKFL